MTKVLHRNGFHHHWRLNDLQRYPGQPTAAFKAYIGDDPFQLLLVVEKKEAQTLKQVDNYIVEHALPDFTSTLTASVLAKSSPKEIRTLTIFMWAQMKPVQAPSGKIICEV